MEKTKGIITANQLFLTLLVSRIVVTLTYSPVKGVNLFTTESLLYLPFFFFFLFACALPLYLLFRAHPGKNILDCAEDVMGKGASRVTAILFLFYFIYDGSIITSQFHFFASSSITKIPIFIFSCMVLAAAAYAATLGIEPICRIGVVICIVVLLSFAFIGITVTPQLDFSLMPIPHPTLSGGFKTVALELSRTTELAAAAFLLPCAKEKKGRNFSILLVVLTLVLEGIVFLPTNLLGKFATLLFFPFYEVSSIADELIAQRFDAFTTSIWSLGIFIKLALLLYVLRQAFHKLTKGRFGKIAIWTGAVICALISSFYSGDVKFYELRLLYTGFQLLMAFLAVILPLLLLIGYRIKSRPSKSNRKPKKKAALALLLIPILLLTSCATSSVTQRLLFIECMAVDKTEQGYRITMQVFTPTQGSPAGEDTGQTPTSIFSCEGQSLSEAFQNISLKSGKRPVYSKNRLIILGRSIAENDLFSAIDYLMRDYESRSAVHVAMAEEEAGPLVQVNMNNNIIPTQEMIFVIEQTSRNSLGVNVKLLDLAAGYADSGVGMYAPVLRAVENSQREQNPDEEGEKVGSTLEVCGTAIFQQGRLQTILTLKETRGFLLASGKFDTGIVTFETEKFGQVSVKVDAMKTSRLVTIENGVPNFTIELEGKGGVSELEKSSTKSVTLDQVEFLEDRLSRELSQLCQEYLNAQAKEEYDIAGLGRMVQSEDTETWKTISKSWYATQKKSRFTVFVRFNLTKTGQLIDFM